MVEYGRKIGEEVEAMQSEIKIHREPTVKGRELGIQPEQNEETRIQKKQR